MNGKAPEECAILSKYIVPTTYLSPAAAGFIIVGFHIVAGLLRIYSRAQHLQVVLLEPRAVGGQVMETVWERESQVGSCAQKEETLTVGSLCGAFEMLELRMCIIYHQDLIPPPTAAHTND